MQHVLVYVEHTFAHLYVIAIQYSHTIRIWVRPPREPPYFVLTSTPTLRGPLLTTNFSISFFFFSERVYTHFRVNTNIRPEIFLDPH